MNFYKRRSLTSSYTQIIFSLSLKTDKAKNKFVLVPRAGLEPAKALILSQAAVPVCICHQGVYLGLLSD